MDPKHSGDMLKHLEKQNVILMDAYRLMSHEVHRLQVEEEMLMRKYYEFMAAQGLTEKKRCSTNAAEDEETGQAGAIVEEPSDEPISPTQQGNTCRLSPKQNANCRAEEEITRPSRKKRIPNKFADYAIN